jgi:hypothetical protein
VHDRNEPAATPLYHSGATAARGDVSESGDEHVIFSNIICFRGSDYRRIARKTVKGGRITIQEPLYPEAFAVADGLACRGEHLASETASTDYDQILHDDDYTTLVDGDGWIW